VTGSPPTPDRIGTVAEEVAKLLALLGQRTPEPPMAEPGDPGGEEEAYAGHPAYDATDGTEPPAADGGEDTCREHPRAGEALTCALCPVCQGIAVLRTLHPETVDRLADLATAAAAALRALAAGAARSEASPRPGNAHRADRSARARRVDIDVMDEEELHP
jgi:hypothetical protein